MFYHWSVDLEPSADGHDAFVAAHCGITTISQDVGTYETQKTPPTDHSLTTSHRYLFVVT